MSRWERVSLDQLCEKKIESITSKDNYIIDYIDISSIDNALKIITFYQTLHANEAPSRAKQILKKNDILVSTVRPNLNAVAINTLNSNNVVLGSTGYCVLRCNDRIDVNYLFNFCKSKGFVGSLVKVAKGASYPAVSNADVKKCKVPLPPLGKQKQIAKTLDTVAELLTMRKQQFAELDNLIKSTFYEMFGDLVINPFNYKTLKLGEIGELSSGGTPTRTNPGYFLGEINWYSAGELNERYLTGSKEKITPEAISKSAAKIFKQGSMLIGMYDTAALKLGILKRDSSSNQACANIEIYSHLVNIEWLYDCLQEMRPYLLNNRRGVRQQNLNLGMIRDFKIPLPPLELQNKFASIVAKIEEQKKLVKLSIDETQLLFDSLMSQYFD